MSHGIGFGSWIHLRFVEFLKSLSVIYYNKLKFNASLNPDGSLVAISGEFEGCCISLCRHLSSSYRYSFRMPLRLAIKKIFKLMFDT